MSTPIDKIIMNAVKCTKCGAGYGQCNCWIECKCGWLYESVGGKCENPIHKADRHKKEHGK